METQPLMVPVDEETREALRERYPWGQLPTAVRQVLREGIAIDPRKPGSRPLRIGVRLTLDEREAAMAQAEAYGLSRREYLARVLEALVL